MPVLNKLVNKQATNGASGIDRSDRCGQVSNFHWQLVRFAAVVSNHSQSFRDVGRSRQRRSIPRVEACSPRQRRSTFVSSSHRQFSRREQSNRLDCRKFRNLRRDCPPLLCSCQWFHSQQACAFREPIRFSQRIRETRKLCDWRGIRTEEEFHRAVQFSFSNVSSLEIATHTVRRKWKWTESESSVITSSASLKVEPWPRVPCARRCCSQVRNIQHMKIEISHDRSFSILTATSSRFLLLNGNSSCCNVNYARNCGIRRKKVCLLRSSNEKCAQQVGSFVIALIASLSSVKEGRSRDFYNRSKRPMEALDVY